MRYDGMPTVCTPFTTIEPVRRPTMPRILFRVDVRPAPLRPSRVTTSPRLTTKSTPCSTWDSPYHACRLLTASISRASGMHRPHVRFHDLGVLRYVGVRPLGEHRSALEHGDRVGDTRHDAHVVLDHQHRAPLCHRLDQP